MSKRPGPGVPRPYSFPASIEHSLANGLRVAIVPMSRLPAATVLYTADAGAERDDAATAGAASLAAQALGEGTDTRSAAEVAATFERLGGELVADAGWTHAEAGTTVLSARLPATMAILAEVVQQASFPEAGLERLRKERLSDLLQQRAEPRGLADDLFASVCFGGTDRYGIPAAGSEQSVSACTGDTLRAFHRARHTPRSSLLIVSGDVIPDEVIRLAEASFGAWEDREPPVTTPRTVMMRAGRGVYVAHKPDAPQSEIRVGHASVERTHPDFMALAVMNAILGGVFNSRINLNLREERAYTYGAFSSFDWRRHGSVFEVSTAVKSDVTADAVREILREIDRMRHEPVQREELSLAIDYLTGVFPLRFETTAAIADAIAFREHFGLGRSYYDEYRTRLSRITIAEVQRVAETHLRPERLQHVIVGDARLVSEPLAALDLGDVERLA
ncbi:MAG: insulinase family protein [Gemmatimonadaceae bacterium]|nr:insulinase family protein [Gemmatimonadaceae bacterium]